MAARNDPVLDSGYPQVDHPGPRGRFRGAWVWSVPQYLPERVWGAACLALFAMLSIAIWAWRTRALSCARCGQRIFRVGADSEGAYYPCSWCRVMWRSSAERLPKVDDFD